jgi:Family of unknown function (DUF6236)
VAVGGVSDVAIYHPSINLPRNRWLDLSLFYWRRLLRVVPPGYSKPRPAYMEELEAADLVRTVEPAPGHEVASDLFLAALTQRRDDLIAAYRLSTGSAWGGVLGNQSEVDPGLTYMHVDKVSVPLKEELIESGLALWDPEGWLGLHPRLARAYMAALVDQIAAESGASPVSDDPVAHLMSGAWSAEKISDVLLAPASGSGRPAPDLAASLALISIRMLAPSRPLSFEEIISIRERYGEELRRFREFIVAVVTSAELGEVTRPDALQMHLEDLHRSRIEPELQRVRADLDLLNVETMWSVLNIRTSLPPAIAMLATEAGLHQPAVSAGAAVVASVLGLRQELVSASRRALAEAPVAFLWRVDEQLHDLSQAQRALRAAAGLLAR